MRTVSIAIIASVLTIVGSATNYCSSNLCPSGKTHIGCGNNGRISEDCPVGRTYLVSLTNDVKTEIVHRHNSKRNTIAAGNLQNFNPAVRMATMRWDDELALLASYNVKTCKFMHDQCHNTRVYKNSGQNLGKYWSPTTISFNKAVTTILEIIDSWWDENVNATRNDIEKYPNQSQKPIGKFTVMAAQKNVAVGCAAIRFPDQEYPDSLTLACNYATKNIKGKTVYVSGPTASKCMTGRDSQYYALCSRSETYG